MTGDALDSFVRSILKIGGTIGITLALSAAFQIGAILIALFAIVGTVAIMTGLGWSYFEHTYIGGRAPVTLRTVDPAMLPPEVKTKMEQT